MIFQKIIPFILLNLYRVFFMPIGLFLAASVGLFNPKIREGFKLRLQARRNNKGGLLKEPLWIHVSSGEFEYAKPLLPRLKEKYPNSPILVTYYSPSYRKPIENHPLVDLALPLPLDFSGACSSFLNKHKPKMLLIARTDLWPEMLYRCRQRNIPTCIFSARCTQYKSIFSYFSYWTYQLLDHVFCVSEEYKQEFIKHKISAEKITVCGDTRFDQAFERLQKPKPNLKTQLFEDSEIPLFIAGSTWEPDETVLIPQLQTALINQKIKLILVPHEPHEEHLLKLEELCRSHQLSCSRYSQATEWSSSILIVDKLGLLADIYPYGDFAFIGNSFNGEVHSVMEALAAGCLCFVGPKHLKSPESLEFKKQNLTKELKMVNVINKNNLSLKLNLALDSEQNFKTSISENFSTYLGASDQLIKKLDSF